MSKHTPRPWLVGGSTGLINQVAIEPAIGCCYGAGDEVAANARLIAAAPDLLEALRMFVRAGVGNRTDWRLQLAALREADEIIQKATGEAA